MNLNLTTYLLYFLITTWVIIYVGMVLYKNGRPFLIEVFRGDIHLSDAINKMLLVGYYLVNIGYTVIGLKIWKDIKDWQELIEVLGRKVGFIVLILGIMHLINVIVLIISGRVRKKTIINHK